MSFFTDFPLEAKTSFFCRKVTISTLILVNIITHFDFDVKLWLGCLVLAPQILYAARMQRRMKIVNLLQSSKTETNQSLIACYMYILQWVLQ